MVCYAYFQWIDYVKGTFTTTEKSKVTAVLTSGSTGAFPSLVYAPPNELPLRHLVHVYSSRTATARTCSI